MSDDKDRPDWRREASPLITLGYIHLFHLLKLTAMEYGYALTVHGSMCRDLDLVAVPWTDAAAAFETLVGAFCEETGAALSTVAQKPHGRQSVLLILPHGNGSIIDLSVTARAEGQTFTGEEATLDDGGRSFADVAAERLP